MATFTHSFMMTECCYGYKYGSESCSVHAWNDNLRDSLLHLNVKCKKFFLELVVCTWSYIEAAEAENHKRQLGLQQLIDKIDYYRLWKSSTTILIID